MLHLEFRILKAMDKDPGHDSFYKNFSYKEYNDIRKYIQYNIDYFIKNNETKDEILSDGTLLLNIKSLSNEGIERYQELSKHFENN